MKSQLNRVSIMIISHESLLAFDFHFIDLVLSFHPKLPLAHLFVTNGAFAPVGAVEPAGAVASVGAVDAVKPSL